MLGCSASNPAACVPCATAVLLADVNHAHGTLHLHGTMHKSVPVHLEYSRPDESMHLRLVTKEAGQDGCVLVFDAQTASDASLHPIPGTQMLGARQHAWTVAGIDVLVARL